MKPSGLNEGIIKEYASATVLLTIDHIHVFTELRNSSNLTKKIYTAFINDEKAFCTISHYFLLNHN